LLGQYHRAVDFYQQSLDIYRKIGNLHGEAASLNGLGNTCKSLRQSAQAITDPIPKEDWVERSLDHNSAP
jgi:Tetratricopeptide repeat